MISETGIKRMISEHEQKILELSLDVFLMKIHADDESEYKRAKWELQNEICEYSLLRLILDDKD